MQQTFEGSHQQYGVIVDTNVMVPARDGVELATDIFYPAEGDRKADGRFPAILERTPYDKATARQVTKGKFFARRGYVVTIQDVRGRFKSEEFATVTGKTHSSFAAFGATGDRYERPPSTRVRSSG